MTVAAFTQLPTHPRRPGGSLAVVAAVALACGCGAAPQVGPVNPDHGGTAGTFSSIEANILVPRCASAACHGGDPAPAFPRLDAGAGWAAMVGIPSQQLPSMSVVEPFDPERSYLVLKLRGTAGSAGGNGSRMPLYDAPLDDADQAAIEAWIAAGAPND